MAGTNFKGLKKSIQVEEIYRTDGLILFLKSCTPKFSSNLRKCSPKTPTIQTHKCLEASAFQFLMSFFPSILQCPRTQMSQH